MQTPDRAALYARLKLASLDDGPCQIAVFADCSTAQGGGLGRLTMPEALEGWEYRQPSKGVVLYR